MAEKTNLPAVPQKKIQELFEVTNEMIKADEIKTILNSKPPDAWLKDHPTATKEIKVNGNLVDVPVQYLPIDKVELMLDRMFQKWKVEILGEGVMFHSVYVKVRLHYQEDPSRATWSFHDGIGAMKVQTDKGASAADLSKIKFNAVQIALPAAVSYAIKDAAEHIGKIFGRDINRADTIAFSGAYLGMKPKPEDKSEERLEILMNNATTRTKLQEYQKHCVTPALRTLYDELYKNLK